MRLKSMVRRVPPFLRTARMAFRSRAVILLYHRVAAPAIDSLLLCTSPAYFAEHLEVIRKDYTPISLAELAAAHAAGRIPERAVAITFDDGYADNIRTAVPLLEESGQQATVFVAGACLERKSFFYDELEEILLLAPRLPRKLRFVTDDQRYEWDLGSWARLPKSAGDNYWKWNMESPNDPTPRHRCYRDLFNRLRGATPEMRRCTLLALREAARIEPGQSSTRRLMTMAELRKAAQGDTLEFGAHTRTHPALNRLSLGEQRDEILSGKRILEEAIGKTVRAFAYPYGSPWDVTADTVRLAREAGFSLACANSPGPVDSESDPFWLPRCLVRDWDGKEFALRMQEFFHPRAEIPPQG